MSTLPMKTLALKKYDLIIFDCDGTLVDSEALSNKVIAELMRELGIKITDQEAFDQFAGTTLTYIAEYIERALGQPCPYDLESVFRPRVTAVFEEELKPVVGVSDFIVKVSSLKRCVASNGPQKKMAQTLRVTGLAKYFTEAQVFSAYDVQKWKPEPDLFLYAIEKMGSKSNSTLVIEDSMTGAMAAINGGIDVIVYTAHTDPQPFHEHNIPTFNSFVDLKISF